MTVYSFALTLFLILDPFGNIPLFLFFLKAIKPSHRKWFILREMSFALLILIFFLFFGKYVLQGFNITPPALTISGGFILFLIAIKMIFPENELQVREGENIEGPLLVPLAIPAVAGPSSIATVILFSSKYPERMWDWLLALLIAWGAALAVILCSTVLHRLLGERVLNAFGKLMGIILTVIAVQMLINGVEEAFFSRLHN